ncbi:MAG TPA: hypothetical protein VE996_00770 [Terriglobales bacterium]|nr:hypothetical protein [Terriglobales bacterium]
MIHSGAAAHCASRGGLDIAAERAPGAGGDGARLEVSPPIGA